MTPKRFLFLFSDTGGGHRAGAQAVAQALQHLYGDQVRVHLVDALLFSQKWPFSRLPAWYPHMVRGRAIPWKIGFRMIDRSWMVEGLTRLCYPYVRPALDALMEAYPADVIVSFHALLNRLLGLYVGSRQKHVRTATVVLDFLSAHALWFGRGLDRYFLPFPQLLARARSLGVSADKIVVSGMPVRAEICHVARLPKEAARKQLGISDDAPLVLVVGGGDGIGPMAAVVRALAFQQPRVQIVALTGRNRRLYRQLAALKVGRFLRVEGYSQQMALWLRAADILVTKAGPNSLAEAFVMGLPMVLYAAIPGQEEGNVRLVQSHRAGIWAPTPERAVNAVISLLTHPQRQKEMARQAKRLASPDAAQEIARQLFSLANAMPAPSSQPTVWSG